MNSKWWHLVMKNRVVTNKGGFDTPLRKAIRLMPQLAKDMMDKFIMVKKVHPDEKNIVVTYDFQYLEDSFANWFSNDVDTKLLGSASANTLWFTIIRPFFKFKIREQETLKKIDKSQEIYDKTSGKLLPSACPYVHNRKLLKMNHVLNVLSESKNESLMHHEVVQGLISKRWRSLSVYIYLADFLFYLFFLIMFSTFMLRSYPPYLFTYNGTSFRPLDEVCPISNSTLMTNRQSNTASKYLIVVFGIIRLVLQLCLIITRGLAIINWQTLTRVFLYVSTMLVVLDFEDCSKQTGIRQDWQWQLGALGLFLAWLNLMLFIRKIPHYGIYIILFLKVLVTFCRSSMLYAMFLVAFTYTFHLLLSNQENFQTLMFAGLKSSAMTLGEVDFVPLFFSSSQAYETRVPYFGVTFFIYGLFMLVTSVLVMNLMIGLAVDDIKCAMAESAVIRNIMLIEMILTLEAKLPIRLVKRFVRKELSWRPHEKRCSLIFRWWNSSYHEDRHIAESDETQNSQDFIEYTKGRLEEMNTNIESLHDQFEVLHKVLAKLVQVKEDYPPTASN
ncbi:hypothetical protein Ciccas_009254 [Cichlidogyrus casuarinus]|uniref:Ion transport domain-containing protein n=1 Tax=Cichlidogyrus casuarinus TaxID=1844966 RepID=A0ABD2PY83_9PLAT